MGTAPGCRQLRGIWSGRPLAGTLALLGVGPEHAAQPLITAAGDPGRLRSEAAFAALCAARLHPRQQRQDQPTPAQLRRRQRHLPGALHDHRVAPAVLPRHKAYAKRREAEGLSKREDIRCLKRYVARQLYRAVRADLAATTPTALCVPDDIDRDLHRRNSPPVLEPVDGVPVLGPAHTRPVVCGDPISMVGDRSLQHVDGPGLPLWS